MRPWRERQGTQQGITEERCAAKPGRTIASAASEINGDCQRPAPGTSGGVAAISAAKRHSRADFAASVTSASSASSEAHGEGGDEVVLVVEDLDMQRHGVGLAADVAGDHRDRAELAHRARVAQRARRRAGPSLMFGSVTRQKICQPPAPSTTAASSSSRALLLHQRDQLAGDEREGHEDRGEHDARHARR